MNDNKIESLLSTCFIKCKRTTSAANYQSKPSKNFLIKLTENLVVQNNITFSANDFKALNEQKTAVI